MLASLRDIVEQQLTQYESRIALDELELFGDEKIAATISTPHLMGSIEILKDLTTDLLIVEFDSEDVIYSEVFEVVSNAEELKELLRRYLQKVDAESKGHPLASRCQ